MNCRIGDINIVPCVLLECNMNVSASISFCTSLHLLVHLQDMMLPDWLVNATGKGVNSFHTVLLIYTYTCFSQERHRRSQLYCQQKSMLKGEKK